MQIKLTAQFKYIPWACAVLATTASSLARILQHIVVAVVQDGAELQDAVKVCADRPRLRF